MSETKRLRWTIASARQSLPTLIGMAAREPQLVYRRNKLVAKVVSPETTERASEKPPISEALAELQRICAEENYSLPSAPRVNRRNPFARRRK